TVVQLVTPLAQFLQRVRVGTGTGGRIPAHGGDTGAREVGGEFTHALSDPGDHGKQEQSSVGGCVRTGYMGRQRVVAQGRGSDRHGVSSLAVTGARCAGRQYSRGVVGRGLYAGSGGSFLFAPCLVHRLLVLVRGVQVLPVVLVLRDQRDQATEQ